MPKRVLSNWIYLNASHFLFTIQYKVFIRAPPWDKSILCTGKNISFHLSSLRQMWQLLLTLISADIVQPLTVICIYSHVNVTQIITKFQENQQKKIRINKFFHPLLSWKKMGWVVAKQLVAQFFKSGSLNHCRRRCLNKMTSLKEHQSVTKQWKTMYSVLIAPHRADAFVSSVEAWVVV